MVQPTMPVTPLMAQLQQGQPQHLQVNEPILGVGAKTGKVHFVAGGVPEKMSFSPLPQHGVAKGRGNKTNHPVPSFDTADGDVAVAPDQANQSQPTINDNGNGFFSSLIPGVNLPWNYLKPAPAIPTPTGTGGTGGTGNGGGTGATTPPPSGVGGTGGSGASFNGGNWFSNLFDSLMYAAHGMQFPSGQPLTEQTPTGSVGGRPGFGMSNQQFFSNLPTPSNTLTPPNPAVTNLPNTTVNTANNIPDYRSQYGSAYDALLSAHGVNPSQVPSSIHPGEILDNIGRWFPPTAKASPGGPNSSGAPPFIPQGMNAANPVASFDNYGDVTFNPTIAPSAPTDVVQSYSPVSYAPVSGPSGYSVDSGASYAPTPTYSAPQYTPQPAPQQYSAPSTPGITGVQTAIDYANQGITGSQNTDTGPIPGNPNGIYGNPGTSNYNPAMAQYPGGSPETTAIQQAQQNAYNASGTAIDKFMSNLQSAPQMSPAAIQQYTNDYQNIANTLKSGAITDPNIIDAVLKMSMANARAQNPDVIPPPPPATTGDAGFKNGQPPTAFGTPLPQGGNNQNQIKPPNVGSGGLVSPTGRTMQQIEADPNGYASPEEREWYLNQIGKTTPNHDGNGAPINGAGPYTPQAPAQTTAAPTPSQGSGRADWSNWGEDANGNEVGWAVQAGYTPQQMIYDGSTSFSPAVEALRPIVSQYFAPADVNHALWLIQRESGGDPTVINTPQGIVRDPSVLNGYRNNSSQAVGLFQARTSSGIPQGGSVQQQIANAAASVYHTH